ncbi:Arc family DNA-binding protein [Saccharibacter floricola]|uniref:Arc-like DNA binding domain-containing protein n=1 Tax=Saccharibacter floricola DSM 15669 TaxID=1123227 RepID=A0ABQ0NZS5_9PROT|nr:Arc family DNA-binding protein [Saccharibacter floricola]GBQ07262.1 hypothetical protein AA15669_1303 [Saccharibacter floricola DSM 15669]
MAEDRYTRITLRIPKEVHKALLEAAKLQSHSMNAEIVQRLEESIRSSKDGTGQGSAPTLEDYIENSKELKKNLYDIIEMLDNAKKRKIAEIEEP